MMRQKKPRSEAIFLCLAKEKGVDKGVLNMQCNRWLQER